VSKDHGHHPHGGDQEHHQKHHGSTKPKLTLHKDWRAWLGVLIMIGTIFAYLASMDEANSPVKAGPTQTATPAP